MYSNIDLKLDKLGWAYTVHSFFSIVHLLKSKMVNELFIELYIERKIAKIPLVALQRQNRKLVILFSLLH